METRRPSEWTREARDTPVTRETLWYELDKMQHRVNTQFVLLGRRGERVAKYPDHRSEPGVFDATLIFCMAMAAISLACSVAVILFGSS